MFLQQNELITKVRVFFKGIFRLYNVETRSWRYTIKKIKTNTCRVTRTANQRDESPSKRNIIGSVKKTDLKLSGNGFKQNVTVSPYGVHGQVDGFIPNTFLHDVISPFTRVHRRRIIVGLMYRLGVRSTSYTPLCISHFCHFSYLFFRLLERAYDIGVM